MLLCRPQRLRILNALFENYITELGLAILPQWMTVR
jgi:hypothetical protein